ncbi:MAG: PAS domain-containing protein, partial [Betaproteobacteria bacterium]|nr:PAS domain-containing protein [Betaproteobacteria bacterium]
MGDKQTKRPARSRSGPAGERAEDALYRSNAVLRTLYASTPVLIGVKDRDNRLVSVNQAALDVIGKPE